MLEGFILILLIGLSCIGSVALVFGIIYYYTEVIQPKNYEKENAKRNTEREKRTHEEIDRVIDEALRANY